MRESADKADCQIHAYVLMTNHVHLLVTPARAQSIGQMLQSLGRRSSSRTRLAWPIADSSRSALS
ncbi:MAG: transposase, partial [Chromatiaceae bacterium]